MLGRGIYRLDDLIVMKNTLDNLAVSTGDFAKSMSLIVLEKSLNVRIFAYLHLFVST